MANLNSKNKVEFTTKKAFTNAKAIIPQTGIVAGVGNILFHSVKNHYVDSTTGVITAIPAYEIGKAVVQCKTEPSILCVGIDGAEKFYFGSFVDDTEEYSVLLYPESKRIFTSNFKGVGIYQLIMAMDIAEFILKGNSATVEEAEIFECLNQLHFDSASSNTIFDVDQNEPLIKLMDSIYFEAKKFNGSEMIYQSNENLIDIVMNGDVKYNLIQLIKEDDPLEVNGTVVPEMKAPKKASKKKLQKSSSSNEESQEDITKMDNKILSDDDAKALPVILQVMRQQAVDFYEENKQFLTDEQKSMIKSFKRGKLWKLGLFGPSATGKTSFVKSLAGALGLPFMVVVGSKGMDETALFGKYVLKNGATEFEYGPLTLMMKYGGLFLLDEENMVAPEIISSMNSVLDDSRLVTLESGEVVQCHPNFRYCEAMNMAYAGTLEQNLSHESRIQMFMKMSGYDPETEANIVVKATGVKKTIAKKIVKLKNKIADIIANDPDADDTTQRVDLRSCIAWAERSIDCNDDILQASLSTILSTLVKEDDSVLSSSTVADYEKSQEVAAVVVDLIKEECKNTAPVKKEYVFGNYSL